MDSFGKVKLSESIYLNSFVDTLRDFFFQQLDNNFLMFMDIIRNTDLNRISNIQIRNAAIHLFLKELPDYMKTNHKDFCGSSFSNLDDIGQFFCSILLYGKKKYRVFFSLKGIGSDETKIDLGQVKIYNEKWNFQNLSISIN